MADGMHSRTTQDVQTFVPHRGEVSTEENLGGGSASTKGAGRNRDQTARLGPRACRQPKFHVILFATAQKYFVIDDDASICGSAPTPQDDLEHTAKRLDGHLAIVSHDDFDTKSVSEHSGSSPTRMMVICPVIKMSPLSLLTRPHSRRRLTLLLEHVFELDK